VCRIDATNARVRASSAHDTSPAARPLPELVERIVGFPGRRRARARRPRTAADRPLTEQGEPAGSGRPAGQRVQPPGDGPQRGIGGGQGLELGQGARGGGTVVAHRPRHERAQHAVAARGLGDQPGAKQLVRLARALGKLGPDPDDPDAADPGDGPGPYRLVVVDCPPSLGQLTRSALAAADRAVLVTDPTMFAVSGVQRAFDAVQTERARGNPGLQPLGVLINRVRPRNAEHEFRVAELRELFGPLVFSGVLPDRSAIQQAQGACVPIQRWDTPGAREASAVFTTLLGRVLRAERRPRTPAAPPSTR
jgi:hypothetical protein